MGVWPLGAGEHYFSPPASWIGARGRAGLGVRPDLVIDGGWWGWRRGRLPRGVGRAGEWGDGVRRRGVGVWPLGAGEHYFSPPASCIGARGRAGLGVRPDLVIDGGWWRWRRGRLPRGVGRAGEWGDGVRRRGVGVWPLGAGEHYFSPPASCIGARGRAGLGVRTGLVIDGGWWRWRRGRLPRGVGRAGEWGDGVRRRGVGVWPLGAGEHYFSPPASWIGARGRAGLGVRTGLEIDGGWWRRGELHPRPEMGERASLRA